MISGGVTTPAYMAAMCWRAAGRSREGVSFSSTGCTARSGGVEQGPSASAGPDAGCAMRVPSGPAGARPPSWAGGHRRGAASEVGHVDRDLRLDAVPEHGALDEPVRTVGREVHLVVVLEPERLQIDEEVV